MSDVTVETVQKSINTNMMHVLRISTATYEVVGCTTFTCPCTSPGSEYSIVKTWVSPESTLVNVEYCVFSILFAVETGTSNASQSPAGVAVFGVMSYVASQDVTASTDSWVGLTKDSTCHVMHEVVI